MPSILPRRAPARARATRTATPPARLAAACRRLLERLDRARQQALKHRQLRALNDRLLRDVGLDRADVTGPLDEWAQAQRWRERGWGGW